MKMTTNDVEKGKQASDRSVTIGTTDSDDAIDDNIDIGSGTRQQ